MSTTTPDIIEQLHATLADNDGLGELLARSLEKARERAETGLDPDLRDALDWPGDLDSYQQYLEDFLFLPCPWVSSPNAFRKAPLHQIALG